MTNFLLSMACLAAGALFYGAWRLWRSDTPRGKPILMLIAALVILANIAIITIPDKNGNSLVK
jgi:hypothetical protein